MIQSAQWQGIVCTFEWINELWKKQDYESRWYPEKQYHRQASNNLEQRLPNCFI